MRGRTALLLFVALLAGCSNVFGVSRNKLRSVDGVATFELPGDWRGLSDAIRQPGYALFEFRKTQSWWFGAGDPLEVQAWVVVADPAADDATLQQAIEEAHRRVRPNTQAFPDFGSMKDGDRETWIHEGSYQISPSHKPQRVTFIRSIDRDRKVGLVARVYTKKTPHKSLQKITQTYFTSLQLSDTRAAYFNEVGDWPSVRSIRQQREHEYINAFLAERGLPPARHGETVVHDGWIYTLWDHYFVIGRQLGSRRLETFPYGARGELTWLRYTGSSWTSSRASNAARPPRSEPYYFTSDALHIWATAGGQELDRSFAWFFTVLHCELTGAEWEPPRDPASWDLLGWWDNALRIHAAFTANTLFIE